MRFQIVGDAWCEATEYKVLGYPVAWRYRFVLWDPKMPSRADMKTMTIFTTVLGRWWMPPWLANLLWSKDPIAEADPEWASAYDKERLKK